MPSDTELLRRYAEKHSEEAFAELVGRYLDLVYSSALRQLGGDAHRAQDVAQIVFTTLARKAKALIRHPVLAGWIYTATQHAAAKAIRTEARRHAREMEAHVMREILAGEPTEIDWKRVRPVLDAAMHELRDRDREAVLLRYFARRPFADIGAALNVSEDGARMRVERALEKLRTLLARHGVTSTAGALSVALTQQAVLSAPSGLAAHVTLAAITGSATETFNLLVFMSTTKFIGVSAAVVALIMVGTAFHELQVERTATGPLGVARTAHAAVRARVRQAEVRARAAQGALEEARRALADAETTAKAAENQRAMRVAASPAREQAPRTEDPTVAGNQFLARFPEVKQALLDRSFARIRACYDSLYATLQLTPEQIARFEHIMLDGEGWMMGRGGDDSVGTGPMNLRPGDGRSKEEIEQALRSLLGPDGLQKFKEAADAANQKQFTIALAESLYFTDQPLTGEQARQIGPLASRYPLRLSGDYATRDWDALLAEARPLLKDTQFAALTRMRVQEEFGYTMKSRMLK